MASIGTKMMLEQMKICIEKKITKFSFNSAKPFHSTAVLFPRYLSEKSIDSLRQEHSPFHRSPLHVACFVHWLYYTWDLCSPKRSVTSWKKPGVETTENAPEGPLCRSRAAAFIQTCLLYHGKLILVWQQVFMFPCTLEVYWQDGLQSNFPTSTNLNS